MKELQFKALPVCLPVLISFCITANAQVGGAFQPLPSNQSEVNVAGSVQRLPPPSLKQSKASRAKAMADSMNNGADDRAFWGRQENTSVTTNMAAASINHSNIDQGSHIGTIPPDTGTATVHISNTAASTSQQQPTAPTSALYSDQQQAIQKQRDFKENGFILRMIVIALVIGIVAVKAFSKKPTR